MSAQDGYARKVFEAGEVIFREGDADSQCAYIVEAGKIMISKQGANGKSILGYVGQGGIFGEMALIDNAPRMAQAEAAEKTRVTIIDEARLDTKLHRADPYIRALFTALVKHIREMTAEITSD